MQLKEPIVPSWFGEMKLIWMDANTAWTLTGWWFIPPKKPPVYRRERWDERELLNHLTIWTNRWCKGFCWKVSMNKVLVFFISFGARSWITEVEISGSKHWSLNFEPHKRERISGRLDKKSRTDIQNESSIITGTITNGLHNHMCAWVGYTTLKLAHDKNTKFS